MAVKHVREQHGVNLLACICAVDKATLPTLMDYWVPGVDVAGVHELVGNALVMTGEQPRTTDLRGEPLPEGPAHPGPSASPSPLGGSCGSPGLQPRGDQGASS
jgi:hypothetical protein